jgi:hypothetical protein
VTCAGAPYRLGYDIIGTTPKVCAGAAETRHRDFRVLGSPPARRMRGGDRWSRRLPGGTDPNTSDYAWAPIAAQAWLAGHEDLLAEVDTAPTDSSAAEHVAVRMLARGAPLAGVWAARAVAGWLVQADGTDGELRAAVDHLEAVVTTDDAPELVVLADGPFGSWLRTAEDDAWSHDRQPGLSLVLAVAEVRHEPDVAGPARTAEPRVPLKAASDGEVFAAVAESLAETGKLTAESVHALACLVWGARDLTVSDAHVAWCSVTEAVAVDSGLAERAGHALATAETVDETFIALAERLSGPGVWDALHPHDRAVADLVRTCVSAATRARPGGSIPATAALRRVDRVSPDVRSWACAAIADNLLDERRTGWLRGGRQLDVDEEDVDLALAAEPDLFDAYATLARTVLPRRLAASVDAVAEYYLSWCRSPARHGGDQAWEAERDLLRDTVFWPAVARMHPARREQVAVLLAAFEGPDEAQAWSGDWRDWQREHRLLATAYARLRRPGDIVAAAWHGGRRSLRRLAPDAGHPWRWGGAR